MTCGASRNRTASSETHRNPAVRLRQPRFLPFQGSQLAHARLFEVAAWECRKELHLLAFPTSETIESAETIYY